MKLYEFYDEQPVDIEEALRDAILDILTPLAASKVPFVPLPAMIKKIENLGLGVTVDMELVMRILDPSAIKLITKVENDRIYLQGSIAPSSLSSADEAEKDANHVSKLAADQAKKEQKK